MSVVNMDPEYMAHHDGSEQAAGRGSGRDPYTNIDTLPWGRRSTTKNVHGSVLKREDMMDENKAVVAGYGETLRENTQMSDFGQTPYMNMTYAPQERRIDVAIHRALFASSTRQARQFVIHGAVKVNGQVVGAKIHQEESAARDCLDADTAPPLQMTHPSYLLNPGDMFQVDRENVLYATGKKKPPPMKEKTNYPGAPKAREETEEAEEDEPAEEEAAKPEANAEESVDSDTAIRRLRFLSRLAKKILAEDKDKLKVRKKQNLRTFMKEARVRLSEMGRADAKDLVDAEIVAAINQKLKELSIDDPSAVVSAEQSGAFSAEATADAKKAANAAKAEENREVATPTERQAKRDRRQKKLEWALSEAEIARMKEEINDYDENPYDPSKRYATPWAPRRFMSAFAFIPRYLEVNQNICAAVYLRHPVARRGYAEVPSPFPPKVMQLAFNWYLRRR